MRMSRIYAILAVLLPLCGCFNKDIIDPAIEIPDKRALVVVPFRDENFENGFDSPRGCQLAERVTRVLRDKGEFKVKGQEIVIRLYDEGNPKSLTAKEVAEKTGADYVLMGDVLKWRLQDENTYGLVRGSATIDVSLYETASAARERIKDDKDRDELPANGRGRLALAKRRVTAVFPNEYGMRDIGVSPFDQTPEQIEAGLINSAAVQVSWLLVPHTKDEERLSNGK